MRFLGALLLLVAIAAGYVAYLFLVPFGPAEETFVEIAPGTSGAGIGTQLSKNGIIRSQYGFDLMRAAKGGTLKAGEYRFDHPAALDEVYARLLKGDVYTRAVTIPEGFNIFEVAQAVESAGLGSKEDFLAAERQHVELIADLSPHAASLEGYLFPDTYKFSRHATPVQMLAAMVRRFRVAAAQLGLGESARLGEVPMSQSRDMGHPSTVSTSQNRDMGHPSTVSTSQNRDMGHPSISDTVTMASLVEKEVAQDAERPLVAGVFVNRLTKGMPLETDPTVIYAALLENRWRGTIYASDLKSESAYNTYRHAGLPPGPICSPGLAALKAAISPAKTQYLYFVSDANGHSRFAATIEEHDKNVKHYRAAEGKAHTSR